MPQMVFSCFLRYILLGFYQRGNLSIEGLVNLGL